MRRSEFDRAVAEEFGPKGGALTTDLFLSALGDRTAAQALEAGVAPREIWLALCEASDVPESRRYGVGQREPKK